jgi:hypothetical protein
MKNLIAQFTFFLVLVLITNTGCTQKMVQVPSDAKKLMENKDLFIGKPLKELLNEINPKIKRVIATPSNNIQSYMGNFRFNFMDNEQVNKSRSKNKVPITIVVFVKEYFDWDFHKRPKGKQTVWTSDDVKKYGDLTIVGFRVYGDATTSSD